MKTKRLSAGIWLALSTVLLLPVSAMPQESSDDSVQRERGNMTREQRREAWNNMSEAEREQMQERVRNNPQARERMKSMSPEQRDEMRKRFESMTPEQREQMRQRHGSGKQGGNRGAKQQED